MSKIKNFLNRNGKVLAVSCMAAIMTCFSAISSFAAEADMSTAFSTALSSIQTNILSYVALALPVGLAIFGAIIAIRKGISFVRGLIGK